MAGLLAVFAEFEPEILRERVKAGIAQARKEGKPHGRPSNGGSAGPAGPTAPGSAAQQVGDRLALGIGRTSVRRNPSAEE